MNLQNLIIQLNYTNGVTHDIPWNSKLFFREMRVQKLELDKYVEIRYEPDFDPYLEQFVEYPTILSSVKFIDSTTNAVLKTWDGTSLDNGTYSYFNDNTSSTIAETLRFPLK